MNEGYRTAKVNVHKYLVYDGTELIGQVRMGLDRLWYPELPADKFKAQAIHRLVLAHEAVEQMNGAIDGTT